MTNTQKHALVMLYLGFITTSTPYSTSDLYSTYLSHQTAVDNVFSNAPLLGLVTQAYLPLLSQIVITDPNAVWG